MCRQHLWNRLHALKVTPCFYQNRKFTFVLERCDRTNDETYYQLFESRLRAAETFRNSFGSATDWRQPAKWHSFTNQSSLPVLNKWRGFDPQLSNRKLPFVMSGTEIPLKIKTCIYHIYRKHCSVWVVAFVNPIRSWRVRVSAKYLHGYFWTISMLSEPHVTRVWAFPRLPVEKRRRRLQGTQEQGHERATRGGLQVQNADRLCSPVARVPDC
jgi:hypothetical protein